MKHKQNTHHGKPLNFISLTPAAQQSPAKVAKVKTKAAIKAAAADAAEATYQRGYDAFLAGHAFDSSGCAEVRMAEIFNEGWLDAQAKYGHPPANTPSHARHIARAMLYLLAGALLLGVMAWHSSRVDAKLAAAPAAQSMEAGK